MNLSFSFNEFFARWTYAQRERKKNHKEKQFNAESQTSWMNEEKYNMKAKSSSICKVNKNIVKSTFTILSTARAERERWYSVIYELIYLCMIIFFDLFHDFIFSIFISFHHMSLLLDNWRDFAF
jgi:hypothetical protein